MVSNFNIVRRNKNKFLGGRDKKVGFCYKEEEIAKVFVFLKKSFYEMLIIPQTLSINNFRTISAKLINLHTIRKLIKNSFKNVPVKAMFTLKAIFSHTVLGMLISEGRSTLSLTQRGTGSERVDIFHIH